MSMGSSAAFAEVVEPETIKKILGKRKAAKFDRFVELFNSLEEGEGASSLIDFIQEGEQNAVSDPEDPELAELDQLWDDISDTVKQKTGLDIYVNFHNADDGDCYDEVEGLFFDFSNSQLYQPTEAFKKLQKKYGKEVVTRSFYTVFC